MAAENLVPSEQQLNDEHVQQMLRKQEDRIAARDRAICGPPDRAMRIAAAGIRAYNELVEGSSATPQESQ